VTAGAVLETIGVTSGMGARDGELVGVTLAPLPGVRPASPVPVLVQASSKCTLQTPRSVPAARLAIATPLIALNALGALRQRSSRYNKTANKITAPNIKSKSQKLIMRGPRSSWVSA
jgi:hypothetical protein